MLAARGRAQAPAPGEPQAQLLLVLTQVGEPEPAGFLLALRIQLGGTARVETRSVPSGLDASARSQAAGSTLRAEQARAVIWIDRVDGGRVVYVWHADSAGSPQLAWGQASGDPGPDMDRTLALKVSELLEGPRPQSAEASPAAEAQPAAHARAGWVPGFVAQLAGVASPAAGPGFGLLGPAIAAGVDVSRAALRCAALLDLTWFPPTHRRIGTDVEIEVQELTPALRVHGEAALGAVWLGAHAALALSVLHAQGTSAEGQQGDASETAASWLAGLGVEVPLTAGFGLGLDLSLQGQLRRQRFSIEGAQVADSKRLRPLGRIAISFRPGGRE